MLILYETPAGYALFKANDKTLDDVDSIEANFSNGPSANKLLKLQAFEKFANTADALSEATAMVEGKLSSNLKKLLKKQINDTAGVFACADPKLGAAIAKKFGVKVVSDAGVSELMRGIRSQLEALITGLPSSDLNAMSLGLSHSLSRYKLKFSPDKVDTMIIQAIALLDDLDKELNTYSMRVKEWFGWHFPEMTKVVVDNQAYAKSVLAMKGQRELCSETNFDAILPEEIEEELKKVAEISMGTEIAQEDILSITHLCTQIVQMNEYRTQLYEYLKNRMTAIAPNLTTLVGELVGARLISHAGSLLNLAKAPASTVQILGAEKALFRALKSKKDTPKYGLIYHASLVGQAGAKHKGKMARMLAAKCSLATRVDALGDSATSSDSATFVPDLGIDSRATLENALRRMEGKAVYSISKDKTNLTQFKKAEESPSKSTASYNNVADLQMSIEPVKKEKKEKKTKKVEEENKEEVVKEPKKLKKDKKEKKDKKAKSESSEKETLIEPVEDKKEKKSKKRGVEAVDGNVDSKKSKKTKNETDKKKKSKDE